MYSSTHSLNSALDGGEWSASRPGRFIPRERATGTHWIGGWVGPRAILDAVVKRKIPSPRRKSNPRTPIVQPLAQCYRLSYPGSSRSWSLTREVFHTYFSVTGKTFSSGSFSGLVGVILGRRTTHFLCYRTFHTASARALL
jgi:hypothetical protein